MNACIRRKKVPSGVQHSVIDHRYFYEVEEVGNYTCGVAREAVANQLLEYGSNKFGVTELLTSLDAYIGNQSVTGFFIEQAVLQSISSDGLKDVDGISNPMPIIPFQGFPDFDTKISLALYAPLDFNFHGIDGIILQLDSSKKEAYVFPIQITIAKYHKVSEEGFFNHFDQWKRGLENFNVTATFIWITTNGPQVENVDENYRSHRNGAVLINPAYRSRNIHLRDVNKLIWDRYQGALKKKGRRDQNKVPMLESQASGNATEPEDVEELEKRIKKGIEEGIEPPQTKKAVPKDGVSKDHEIPPKRKPEGPKETVPEDGVSEEQKSAPKKKRGRPKKAQRTRSN